MTIHDPNRDYFASYLLGASADRVRATQELRRSNAAAPVPSGRRYRRKEKHVKRLYKSDEG